jgi:hypothetical protein
MGIFYDHLNQLNSYSLWLSPSLLILKALTTPFRLTHLIQEGAGGEWKQLQEAIPSQALAGEYTGAISAYASQRFLLPPSGIPAMFSDTRQVC